MSSGVYQHDPPKGFSLSVVIPAFNEENRLPRTLENLVVYLERAPFDSEIIVVDDGSWDNTTSVVVQLAEAHQGSPVIIRLLQNEVNRGKGFAVRHGVRAAQCHYILMYDADGATPIAEIARCYAALNNNPQAIVIGSRVLSAPDIFRTVMPHRQFIGRCFHLMVQFWVPGIQDTQCGFKLFPQAIGQALFRQQWLDRFAFDVELLHAAHRNQLAMVEVPVRWFDQPGSKVNLVRDSLHMLLSLGVIAYHSQRGDYNLPDAVFLHQPDVSGYQEKPMEPAIDQISLI